MLSNTAQFCSVDHFWFSHPSNLSLPGLHKSVLCVSMHVHKTKFTSPFASQAKWLQGYNLKALYVETILFTFVSHIFYVERDSFLF
jgi:hypothetical protein